MIFVHLLEAPSCPVLCSLVACATTAIVSRKVPASPVSALQGEADGTARRRKAGPLRDI